MEYKGCFTNRLKNPAERQLFEKLTEEGWYVTKRGWPDFVCFKEDDLILIEVKPRRSHHLKKEQYRLMVALVKLGIRCFRWSPDGGFEPVTPAVKDVSWRQRKKLLGEENAI